MLSTWANLTSGKLIINLENGLRPNDYSALTAYKEIKQRPQKRSSVQSEWKTTLYNNILCGLLKDNYNCTQKENIHEAKLSIG